jgi:quinate dehydrogenase
MRQFPEINLVELHNISDIKQHEPQIMIIVSCIPAIEPVTNAEKRVWSVVRDILSSKTAGISLRQTRNESRVILDLPPRRVLLDMCYKPRFTPFMGLAEEHGWMAISGIEAMLEQGFAQSRMWLAKSSSRAVGSGSGRIVDGRTVGRIPTQVEDKARNLIRSMEDIIPVGQEVPDGDDVKMITISSKL